MSTRSFGSGFLVSFASFVAPAISADIVVHPGQSIQTAIASAFDGDRVLVHPGVFHESLDFLGKDIEVIGVGGAANTVVDAAGLGNRVVTFKNGEPESTRLVGFTIRGGTAPFEPPGAFSMFAHFGGGIAAYDGAAPTIEDCVITDNRAHGVLPSTAEGIGGGVFAVVADEQSPEPRALRLVRCELTANSANWGGGAAGSFFAHDSEFSSNSADYGGGAFLGLGIERCVFSSNIAAFIGGGLCFSDSLFGAGSGDLDSVQGPYDPIGVRHTRFLGNSAGNLGGGCYVDSGAASTVSHCEFVSNRAASGGGAYVYATPGSWGFSYANLRDCLFVSNAATSSGDGAAVIGTIVATIESCTFVDDSVSPSGQSWVIRNCAFTAHPGAIGDVLAPVTIEYCLAPIPLAGNGNIVGTPSFVAPVLGDYHLAPGTFGVDAGTPDWTYSVAVKDLAGTPRVQGGRVDIGALESVTDCNVNGTPDWIEIESRTVSDCDADGVPDSCQVLDDCNGNGLSDACEIRDGLVADCNANLIPDPCELPSASDGDGDGVIDECQYLMVPEEYSTIQAAITSAGDGDTIVVGDGVYRGPGNTAIDLQGKAITLRSRSGPSHCIIDGEGSARGFLLTGAGGNAAKIDGFTVRDARAPTGQSGGGLSMTGPGTPTISRCVFVDCVAAGGGAIAISGQAAPIVLDCIVARCESAGSGGGILVSGGATPIFRRCTIVDNRVVPGGIPGAIGGGGICVAGSASFPSFVSVEDCIVWGNVGPSAGQMLLTGWSVNVGVTHSLVQGGAAAVVVLGTAALQWGAGNLDADPRFVDFEAGDYHLTSNSPASGSGVVGGLDFEGDPAVGASDIGADEFHPRLYVVGDPVPGAAILLRVVGSPGSSVLVFASTTLDYPWISTSYGSFVLGSPLLPGSPFSIPTIHGGGFSSVEVRVPPMLAPGTKLHAQAFLAAPTAAFTNAVHLTLE